ASGAALAVSGAALALSAAPVPASGELVVSVSMPVLLLAGQAGWSSPSARAVASFQAIHDSRAHLIRAGYLDTPANATASPSVSSSGSASPLDCIRRRNSSLTFMASLTGLPISRSVSIEALAWLIEQPSASYETSATAGPSPESFSETRSVTSSPHTGL